MMSITEIEKMTPPERLRAMEALWDALCHEKTEPASPNWHEDVLSQRRSRIESGEAKFYSIEEAKRMLEE
ncbi:addiction module protein [Pelagicoccus mobilis]|uniref:Addiction module protein n=1 Tax=Pelagicoccus mobilis TaxID=415221 RepID=A0A934RUK9_9BACT|nr:addiction module protein [Pelagicoccus mobilis]MBK1876703.1 addiction module protein [Pelagicoccus mobilis]